MANYFAMLLGIAVVLAVCLVLPLLFRSSRLGERVVSDVQARRFRPHRAPVAGLLSTRCSRARSSRGSPPTPRRSRPRSAPTRLAGAAQPSILGTGALGMMIITSPKLSGFVILVIPLIILPLVAPFFGRSVRRRSRLAQDMLAEATAYASEQIGSPRTMQAFTAERTW